MTPLSAKQLAHFKEKLQQLRKDVAQELEHEHEEIEVEREQRYDDVPPISTDTVARMSMHELNVIEAIDEALARIEDGRYGVCVRTGKPIPVERLEALPYADTTVEVEREEEASGTAG
jgi:RNA polymerase-binding protein DksA